MDWGNSPESWHSQKRDTGTPVYPTDYQVHPSKCTVQMVETRENIVPWPQVKLLGHGTRWKGKCHPVFMKDSAMFVQIFLLPI